MSPSEQVRVWPPTAPTMLQLPCGGCLSIDQVAPDPPGSGSLTVTLRAMPVLAASLLVTVMVKPMVAPAVTAELSAGLTTLLRGASTGMLAGPLARLPF